MGVAVVKADDLHISVRRSIHCPLALVRTAYSRMPGACIVHSLHIYTDMHVVDRRVCLSVEVGVSAGSAAS